MAAVHDVNGFTLVLDKICHVTRVFEADQQQGAQFNIKLVDTLLTLKFPDHSTAVLERDRLVEAIKRA